MNEQLFDISEMAAKRLSNLRCPSCGKELSISRFSVGIEPGTQHTAHYTVVAHVRPCPCTPIVVTVA